MEDAARAGVSDCRRVHVNDGRRPWTRACPLCGVALAPFTVTPASWIAGLSVGIVVTLVAALVPALHASRIPPVAAMQESATPDRPLTRLTVAGAVLTALGGGALWAGLTDHAGDGNALPALLVGLLFVLTGVALLAPVLAGPVATVLGGLFRGGRRDGWAGGTRPATRGARPSPRPR